MSPGKESEEQELSEKLSRIEDKLDRVIHIVEHQSKGLDKVSMIVEHQTGTLESLVSSTDIGSDLLEEITKDRKKLGPPGEDDEK